MLPFLAMLAHQASVQRIEGIARDLESLGYAVAVVREPEQRNHIEVAISAPRAIDGFTGWVHFVSLAKRASLGVIGPDIANGYALDWLGDLDGDQWPDFLIHGRRSTWTAWSTGSSSHAWRRSVSVGDGTARECSIADVDGDGVREIIVLAHATKDWGAPTPGAGVRLSVWSGLTGITLHERALPANVRFDRRPTELGDLDGDGWSEVAVLTSGETPSDSPSSEVTVWSTRKLEVVSRRKVGAWDSFAPGHFSYGAVASVGVVPDLDGNGICELIAPAEVGVGPDGPRCTLIEACDALTGKRVWRYRVRSKFPDVECFAAGGSDLDGDGTADVLIGERIHPLLWTEPSGRLVVVSGCDGSTIREHEGAIQAFAVFPQCAEFVSDLDGDGVEDYLATESCGAFDVAGAREKVRVFSGRTGAELLRFP